MPLLLVAIVSGPTSTTGALTAHYPVVCSLSGGMSFTPPLSASPADAPPATYGAVQIEGSLTNCLYAGGDPAPYSGTFGVSVNTAAAKVIVQQYPKRFDYYLDDCNGNGFATILKEIKKSSFTVTWTDSSDNTLGTSYVYRLSSDVATTNQAGEEQLTLIGGGGSVTGDYADNPLVQISMSLVNNGTTTSPASIGEQCADGSVSAVTFDSGTSIAML